MKQGTLITEVSGIKVLVGLSLKINATKMKTMD